MGGIGVGGVGLKTIHEEQQYSSKFLERQDADIQA